MRNRLLSTAPWVASLPLKSTLSASAILNGEVRSKGIEIDEGATIEAKFTKEQELNG